MYKKTENGKDIELQEVGPRFEMKSKCIYSSHKFYFCFDGLCLYDTKDNVDKVNHVHVISGIKLGTYIWMDAYTLYSHQSLYLSDFTCLELIPFPMAK